MRKIIITVALSGGLHNRDTAPYLPEQPEEIVQSAYECWQAGASIVHIHARDTHGKITTDPGIHRKINNLIRERCDLIINNSTGVGPGTTFEERLQVLEAQPDAASFNMGSMVRTKFDPGSIFLNTRSQLEEMAHKIREKGIKPELEIFSQSMFVEAQNLIDKGLVKPPYWFNLVLGSTNQNAIPANIQSLLSMYDYMRNYEADSVFCMTVIGRNQLHLTTLGCLLGSHIRVGMEDNIYLGKGVLATSNAQFVSRTADLVRSLQMEVATPKEARELLGI